MPRQFLVTAPRAGWLTGLDGLRALAVIGVVAYHFLPHNVSGGFLGVDLFFVISGFVITTLLLREITQHQRVDVVAFYRRRARRLLPAVALLVIAVAIASLSYWPDARSTLIPSAASSLLLSANWWLVAGDRSYFVESGRPPMLQHLWSLAVEEQFYLLWPLVAGLVLGCWSMRRRIKRRTIVLRPRALRRFAFVSLLLGGASASAMAILAIRDDVPYGQDSSRIYFGTDTHAMGLLFGAAVAALSYVRALPGARRHRFLRGAFLTDVVALAGLTFLIRAAFTVDEFSPELYRTGFGMYSLIAAGVIACVVRPRSFVAWFLDRSLFTWIGRRSYSIYLWHWPVAVVTRPEVDVTWSPEVVLGVRVLAVLVLAEVSYRCVEQPIRTGQLQAWLDRHVPPARRRRVGRRLAPAAALSALLVATSLGSAWAYSSPGSSAVVSAVSSPGPSWVGTPEPGSVPTEVPPFPSPSQALPQMPDLSTHAAPTPAGAGQPVASAVVSQQAAQATPVPVTVAPPQPTLPPAKPIPDAVSAFGDSVMLGAAPAMRAVMPNVDVHAIEGRQARAVFADLAAVRAAGKLAPFVVIHAGDNGIVSPADLTATLVSLSDRTRVVVITDRVAKAWQDPNNATLARICVRYPNVVLADWYTLSNGQLGWFFKDGLHVRPPGAGQYAALVVQSLQKPR